MIAVVVLRAGSACAVSIGRVTRVLFCIVRLVIPRRRLVQRLLRLHVSLLGLPRGSTEHVADNLVRSIERIDYAHRPLPTRGLITSSGARGASI